nr:immunoglobulin heavy chain junction region [Macaca mulatta]MOW32394.1 immunoglobulin heavy chain junction region [Macaca mulatta]MOW32437.1 immunoglobulin heavy chain junction region [Macaca mulatta]MOW32669.1 immunoglobulin heavy chain junction region [Macaca mulatta]MOW32792.1 immunoglobulin heavy chain junction region [Macaca mulatta]
CTGRHRGDDYW